MKFKGMPVTFSRLGDSTEGNLRYAVSILVPYSDGKTFDSIALGYAERVAGRKSRKWRALRLDETTVSDQWPARKNCVAQLYWDKYDTET